jgi:hypothetical protein
MPLTYDQMKTGLVRFKIPAIGAVVGKLYELRAVAVVCAAIARAHPRDYRKRLSPLGRDRSWLHPSSIQNGGSPISMTVSRLIHDHLFPVDDFWLEDEGMDCREEATVHLGLYQHRISYDEFTDMVSTDPGELSDYAGFPLMACLLGGWLDEDLDRFWAMYAKRFCWGIPTAPHLPGRDHYLSPGTLRKELKKRGLAPLYSMFLAIDGSTGNIFFDFDYETDMPPAIALETLVHLHREWKRAQFIARECDQAFDLITTDPQVYIKFLDAYRASLRKRKAQ